MAQDMMAQQQGQQMEGQGGSNDIAMLVDTVGQGLAILSELVGKTPGTDPAVAQGFASMGEQFASLIEQMSGGKAPQQGTVSPEQGGNMNARPV